MSGSVSSQGCRNLILAAVFLVISGCMGTGSSGKYSTGFKTGMDKLNPDAEVELDLVPVDYTDENQDRGNFSKEALLKQFKDSPQTTVFNGSFFVMNSEKVDAEVAKNPTMQWTTHGNWCGIDGPLGNKDLAAVDGLDQVCKAHKVCYRETWEGNCSCDDKLIQSVRTLESTPPEIKKNMEEYYSNSRCIFKCRYLTKWKDAYIFEQGESRIPENIKRQFGTLGWTMGKLKSDRTKYISASRDYNYLCIEDKNIFEKFESCARNRAGSLNRLQCLEGTYIKKGVVMDIDWDAIGPRDTSIMSK